MIPRATLSLVLLVSCAHSMVHVYELALPSVEIGIANEFFADDPAAGKRLTGLLSNSWRLMWGLGALVAGLLADQFGGRRMVGVYLLGCGATCAVAASSTGRASLFAGMVLMGAFASIYHPAGLALISHETDASNRPRALGIHGIFGSAGIGLAPLFCGAILLFGYSWRAAYWWLMVPGLSLGAVFMVLARHHASATKEQTASTTSASRDAMWLSFFVLTLLASLQGFIYSALMSFLPRYLSKSGIEWFDSAASSGNFMAAGVLFMGCFGQSIAGWWARPDSLERQLTMITFTNSPFLLWMAFATGWSRLIAAGLLAVVHFMHQPIYNSLIAKYTPSNRRSLCYGFSFAMGLGLGSFGAGFAGSSQNDQFVYSMLAATAIAGGMIGVVLVVLSREVRE